MSSKISDIISHQFRRSWWGDYLRIAGHLTLVIILISAVSGIGSTEFTGYRIRDLMLFYGVYFGASFVRKPEEES